MVDERWHLLENIRETAHNNSQSFNHTNTIEHREVWFISSFDTTYFSFTSQKLRKTELMSNEAYRFSQMTACLQLCVTCLNVQMNCVFFGFMDLMFRVTVTITLRVL